MGMIRQNMVKIIGGEFAIEDSMLDNHRVGENSFDRAYYSSGRCAFYAILKDIERTSGKNRILLPNYLCDSVTKVVMDTGWEFLFYNINCKMEAELSDLYSKIDGPYAVVLLINYFGMSDLGKVINRIRCIPDVTIIVDNVQATYAAALENIDYSFNSYRKWFPCPDGAVAKKYTEGEILDIQFGINNFVKYKYAGNLLKQYRKIVDDDVILELLNKGEEQLDSHYLCKCSENSNHILSNLDKNRIATIRKNNARILHEELIDLEIDHIYDETTVPLFIPILIENRDYVKKQFYDNGIFTPTHWNYVSDHYNGENILYEKELSLIVDQRYTEEDMIRQINILKKLKTKGMI